MNKNSLHSRNFGYKESNFGRDTYGHDITAYGNTTGKKMFWDASADTLYIVGNLNVDGAIAFDSTLFEDAETLSFGTGTDVSMQWDGTNFIISAAADDSLIEIGDSAATQKSFDIKLYGNESNGASYLYFDASENLLYTEDIDIRIADADILSFGDADDVTIQWDATNLLISAAADDTLIEFGDSNATQKSFDIKIYGNGASGIDYLYFDASRNLLESTGIEISSRKRFEIFDDFVYRVVDETTTPWILNSGNDGQAIDPAISVAEGGVLLMTTGDADGSAANDAVQFVCHIPIQADSGGLVFETRLHINTAITEISVIAGFTDVTTLEEPFTIATATITSNASDAACFVYDDGATTKEWFACAVDGNTDDTGNAATGSAPVADIYQVLRIEVSADGATILFYVDGALVKTLSGAAGVSPDVNLYATVVACATTTTSKTVDVDYIYVGSNR